MTESREDAVGGAGRGEGGGGGQNPRQDVREAAGPEVIDPLKREEEGKTVDKGTEKGG